MNTAPPSATESSTENVAQNKIVNRTYKRNIKCIKQSPYDATAPNRTKNHSSPTKQSAANRHSGQPVTRAPVNKAMQHELAEARLIASDLADHMFGHIVPTNLAKDILRKLVSNGDVQVYGSKPHVNTKESMLDPLSDDILYALDAAAKDVERRSCLPSRSFDTENEMLQEREKRAAGDKKGERKQVSSYFWKWRDFPEKPIKDDTLVEFLNKITDMAFDIAHPQLDPDAQRKNRFAAPRDKHHAVPLPYEVDGEDMRPDFFLLPIEAFSNDMETVNEQYINFTVMRAVGESKSTDLGAGLLQVHRYARGVRRAQPWVHFVTAMVMTGERVALLRGDSSGTERLELTLSSGRGCVEFIRILLGLVLADGEELGQNPDVELGTKTVSCKLTEPKSAFAQPTAGSASGAASATQAEASKSSRQSGNLPPSSSQVLFHPYNSSIMSDHEHSATHSSASKRNYVEVDHSVDGGKLPNPTKRPKITHVERIAFIPLIMYGHICTGILFTTSSIRGRSTTVFCVVDLRDNSKLLALKMSWQDLEREEEQNGVFEKLKSSPPHANVVVPTRCADSKLVVVRGIERLSRITKSLKKGKPCTTLEAIRGLSDDELCGFPVENRVLTITMSELKRPVKFFWGVHDFVRGLRGALLGHEYLTSIGILHRDISENNVVLARRPGEERGYLIDIDMATILPPEEAPVQVKEPNVRSNRRGLLKSSSPMPVDESRPLKALRTGTTPYMSFNILDGGMHTHYDDIESFLYVLLLFFFSYAGPLSRSELEEADKQGFVHLLGSGRLPHLRRWPPTFMSWAEASLGLVSSHKEKCLGKEDGLLFLFRNADVRECMMKNWPKEDLRDAIEILLEDSWNMFIDSRRSSDKQLSLGHTRVSHREFVAKLDLWLEEFANLEDKYSSCPTFQ